MKKLLGILAAIGLVATSGATVVACGNKTIDESSDKENKKELSNFINVKDLGEVTGSLDLPPIISLVNAINVKNPQISLKASDVDFDGARTEKTATLIATNDSEFTGKVTLTFNYSKVSENRSNFELSLVEEVIKGESVIAGVVRPSSLNKGFLMVPSVKNKKDILDSIKIFVGKVLEKAKSFGYNIEANVIFGMIEIDYLDADNNKVLGDTSENDIKSIIIKVKEGHENDVDGYTATKSANVNIKLQKNLNNYLNKTELGDIMFTDVNDDYNIKKELILKLLEVNNELDNNLTEQFEVSTYDLSAGIAVIKSIINSDYTLGEKNITFVTQNKPNENLSVLDLNQMSEIVYGMGYYLSPEFENNNIGTEFYNELIDTLFGVEDEDYAQVYWVTTFAPINKKFFLDSQVYQNDDGEKFEKGDVKLEDFKKDFKDIFDITIDTNVNNEEYEDANGSITLKVKNGQENKYKNLGYYLSGQILIYCNFTQLD